MTKTTLLATAAAIVALAAGSASAENWDMPMAYPASNFHSENGAAFAEAVGLCTGGELTITIHPGGSLYKGGEIKRAVQTAQVPIGERLLSAHANDNPIFGFDSIPFLATSYGDSDKLYAAAKPTLEKTLDDESLVLLYSVPWPPQGLYFKKEINSLDDMKGIKFRAYNAATADLASRSGMLPVQIEAAELTQALATGVAESFISSGSTGYDSKVWEQLSHFYDTQAWLPRNYVFANKAAFEGLPEAQQNCLRAVGHMAGAAGTARSQQLAGWYLSQLAENGMTVQPPSADLKSGLDGIGGAMTNDWLEAAGPEGQAIVEAFKAE